MFFLKYLFLRKIIKNITLLFLSLATFSVFAQDKLTSTTEEFFNGTSWVEFYKTEYVYDSNGNLITERTLTDINADGNLEVDFLTTYAYNTDNLVTEENSGDVKYEYTYTNKLLTLIVSYELDDNDNWVKEDRFEISYNGNKIDNYISYGWDGQNWVLEEENSERTKYVYTGDNLTLITYEDYKDGTWVDGGKDEFSYDANNRIIKEEYFSRNDDSSFQLEDFYNYTYDSSNNVIRETSGYFDTESGMNEDFEPATYQYDTTMLMSNITNPFKNKFGVELFPDGSDNFVNKILSKTSETTRTIYNYNGATASTKDFNSFSFTAYPNPTTSKITVDKTNFSIKSIEVYNLLGKKVISSFSNSVNLEKFNSGVYFLKVNTNDGKVATKRIVKH